MSASPHRIRDFDIQLIHRWLTMPNMVVFRAMSISFQVKLMSVSSEAWPFIMRNMEYTCIDV